MKGQGNQRVAERFLKTGLCAVLLGAVNGCALKPKMIASNYVPPKKIAVLPMSNQSNDLKGPEYIRKELVRHLQKRGYTVFPVQETDEILRTKLGINDGGQLNSTTPEKVGEALGADGLIYGDLINFKFVNVGFYQNRLVEAHFKMIDKSGTPLWEDQRKSSRKEIQTSLKGAGNALARGLAEKAVENMAGVPLWEDVQAVVRMTVSTLPRAK